jgi:hypothetical protein
VCTYKDFCIRIIPTANLYANYTQKNMAVEYGYQHKTGFTNGIMLIYVSREIFRKVATRFESETSHNQTQDDHL